MGDPRPGEILLPFDPADRGDAQVHFIGTIRSPWTKDTCPKNIGRARETGQPALIELRKDFGIGLQGLAIGQPIVLLYWMDQADRNIILQRPRHTDGPRGVFALRSPARPNPIAMCTVRITSLDAEAGQIGIDAIDVFDGTPLVDLKPWLETVDIPPAPA
ncbi:MAG: tRNA (N6-threonylcarbamoyladenosine(37)-N6)-methyltransferase TrmO [Pseudomonadota bacterium]